MASKELNVWAPNKAAQMTGSVGVRQAEMAKADMKDRFGNMATINPNGGSALRAQMLRA